MEIRFNVSGADRKALVNAIGQVLGVKPKYLGMPSAAYKLDYITVDKNGAATFDGRVHTEKIENLIEFLAERGFVAEEQEADSTTDEIFETAENNTAEPETELPDAMVGLTVQMPRSYLTEDTIGNLENLIEAKGSLIKKALEIEKLPIEISEEKVSFPWFSIMPEDSATVNAYTHLIYALCELARNQKRIAAIEREVDNEKYAFRCFLLRLGFIGDEYKLERKILLKKLYGSSAFKGGTKNKVSE
ncbi:hypothetical protein SDC9_111208 [bioreactor metagenome]|uniref:Virulence protein n=1 Tax=bioreactor metagenome TaxID=1076179 RepID=A0A645BG56_9ZZZZ|nr:virulence protein [Candidatus Metalachnospira sp.]